MPPEYPDPEEAKRILAALASLGNRPGEVRPIIDGAVDSTCHVERAAVFMDSDGFSRLTVAIEKVDSTGNQDLARDGQRAKAAFEWFKRAAATDSEHFRPGHGMDLTVGAKLADR